MGEEKINIQKAIGLLESLGIQPYLRGYKMTLMALERIAENQERIYAAKVLMILKRLDYTGVRVVINKKEMPSNAR